MAYGVIVGLPILLFACTKDNPGAAGSSDNLPPTVQPPSGDPCAEPNEGCACNDPGKTVECGRVKYQSGDNVGCEIGSRTCANGTWGACTGPATGLKTATVKRGLYARAFATGPGPCTANPCAPYCVSYDDTAPGIVPDAGSGLTSTDGGIELEPGAPATVGESAYTGTAGGYSTCGGGSNIGLSVTGIGATCTPVNALTTCQQDTRCDPVTNKCAWNGPPGYFDATAGGIDITVGTPCGENGSAESTVPLCNRGTTDIPAGAVIQFYRNNAPADGCAAPSGTNVGTLTLANAMVPGQCVSFGIGNSVGTKYVTAYLTSGATEVAGRCANNSAYWNTDGSPGCASCSACPGVTTITGKVYDPSGYSPVPTGVTPADSAPSRGANNIPLAGISVFQPIAPLTTLNPLTGVTCESCDSLSTTSYSRTTTDGTGSFTLQVTPGQEVPIVVQSGRWRRMVTVPVAACTTNNFETAGRYGTFRLPRSVTDGLGGVASIPRLAITTGSEEALECLLAKIGVADNQFGAYTAAAVSAGTPRILLFRDNGLSMAGIQLVNSGATPAGNPGLFFNALSSFNAVLSDCGTGSQLLYQANSPSVAAYTARRNAIRNYVNAGGRYFANHRAGELYVRNSTDPTWTASPASAGAAGVVNWENSAAVGNYNKVFVPADQTLPTGASTEQATFRTWLTTVNANAGYGPNFTRSDYPTNGMRWVGNSAIAWMRSNGSLPTTGCTAAPNSCQNTWDGNAYNRVLSVSFKSGTGGVGTNCGTPNSTGLVLYNEMHVSQTRSPSTGTFPTVCVNDPLSPEEKALEYQIFQLTACPAAGQAPPPPPPPTGSTPTYVPATFVRDFRAVCPTGTSGVWSYFWWDVEIPGGADGGTPATPASVAFRAASGDDLSTLPTTPDPLATVPIGTATTTNANGVDTDGTGTPVSVNTHLKNDPPTFTPPQPPQVSREWLRVYMTLNPSSDARSPILKGWRATYDCVPSE